MHVMKPFAHSFALTELEKYQLTLLIDGFPVIDLNQDNLDKRLLTIIRHCSTYLPQRLAQFLLDFRANPYDDGAVLIQNLPLDTRSEWLLMLCVSLMGDLVADKARFDQQPYIQDSLDAFTRSFCASQQDYIAFLCLREGSDARAIISATGFGHVLQAGEMLILDSEIIAGPIRYDGQGQWLRCLSGVRDARRLLTCA